MMRYFIYFFFVSIVLGILISILFAHFASARPAVPGCQKQNKWRVALAIVLWIVAAFMGLSATLGSLAMEVFTNTTNSNSIVLLGIISSLNAMFIFIALGIYAFRFRPSDSSVVIKLSKVLGYGLLLCMYFYYISITSYIVQLFS